MSKEQQHPLYTKDTAIVNSLLNGEASDFNLAELARLRIRYNGFPGARDIQANLDAVMQQWGLSEEELFRRTQAIHDAGGIYESRGKKEEQDWNWRDFGLAIAFAYS